MKCGLNGMGYRIVVPFIPIPASRPCLKDFECELNGTGYRSSAELLVLNPVPTSRSHSKLKQLVWR